jgi:hypothetical protein
MLTARAPIPYIWWVELQSSIFTQSHHFPEGTFASKMKPKACTASMGVAVWRASARPAESERGCVALWRASAAVSGRGLCVLIVVGFAFGSHGLIGAGGVLGGDDARVVEVRHGDSGFCGKLDGVARPMYVPSVGQRHW